MALPDHIGIALQIIVNSPQNIDQGAPIVFAHEMLARQVDANGHCEFNNAAFLQHATPAELVQLDCMMPGLAAQHLSKTNSTLFINVAPATLADPDTANQYLDALEVLKPYCDRVVLELTEIPLRNETELDYFASYAERIRGRGFALALDDFDLDESSQHHLRLVGSASHIKLLMKDFRNLETGSDEWCEKAQKIQAFKNLGLQVVMEQIESPAEAQQARLIGADYLQGYAHGKPDLAPGIFAATATPAASLQAELMPAKVSAAGMNM